MQMETTSNKGRVLQEEELLEILNVEMNAPGQVRVWATKSTHIQLAAHTAACSPCYLFKEVSNELGKNGEHLH